jgi:hypothetical protein
VPLTVVWLIFTTPRSPAEHKRASAHAIDTVPYPADEKHSVGDLVHG